ncbi:MAG: oxoglutarate dehydrogenase (succinyl-transferring), component, partial [Pseudomonadota bacterium]
LYAEHLIGSGVIAEADAKALVDGFRGKLDKGEVTTDVAESRKDEFAVDWTPWLNGKLAQSVKTGLAQFSLESLAKKISAVPDGFKPHARVAKIYEDRRKMLAGELDMGHARALLSLPGSSQVALAQKIVAQGLSVREAERMAASAALVSGDLSKKKLPKAGAVKPDLHDQDLRRLAQNMADIVFQSV